MLACCQVHAAIEKAGRIDVLICSAGASYPGMHHPAAACRFMHAQVRGANQATGPAAGRFLEQEMAIFESTMDVNYFGTLRMLKSAIPGMVGRGEGEVVLISSSAAVCGAQGLAAAALSA
jgi:NAD(P)-dependent dehydrogenase (short-subunit alcohol dehydrogenase family)